MADGSGETKKKPTTPISSAGPNWEDCNGFAVVICSNGPKVDGVPASDLSVLRKTHADGVAMCSMLTYLGYTIVDFIVCLPGVDALVTRARIERALWQMKLCAVHQAWDLDGTKVASMVVAFAGHGVEQDGTLQLLIDNKPSFFTIRPSHFKLPDGFCGHHLVIFDTCHSVAEHLLSRSDAGLKPTGVAPAVPTPAARKGNVKQGKPDTSEPKFKLFNDAVICHPHISREALNASRDRAKEAGKREFLQVMSGWRLGNERKKTTDNQSLTHLLFSYCIGTFIHEFGGDSVQFANTLVDGFAQTLGPGLVIPKLDQMSGTGKFAFLKSWRSFTTGSASASATTPASAAASAAPAPPPASPKCTVYLSDGWMMAPTQRSRSFRREVEVPANGTLEHLHQAVQGLVPFVKITKADALKYNTDTKSYEMQTFENIHLTEAKELLKGYKLSSLDRLPATFIPYFYFSYHIESNPDKLVAVHIKSNNTEVERFLRKSPRLPAELAAIGRIESSTNYNCLLLLSELANKSISASIGELEARLKQSINEATRDSPFGTYELTVTTSACLPLHTKQGIHDERWQFQIGTAKFVVKKNFEMVQIPTTIEEKAAALNEERLVKLVTGAAPIVNLSATELSDAGVVTLTASFLVYSHEINKLFLAKCELSHMASQAIFQHFSRNPNHLNVLDMSGNGFDKAGAEAAIEFVDSTNNHLNRIATTGCWDGILDKGLEAKFKARVAARPKMEIIDAKKAENERTEDEAKVSMIPTSQVETPAQRVAVPRFVITITNKPDTRVTHYKLLNYKQFNDAFVAGFLNSRSLGILEGRVGEYQLSSAIGKMSCRIDEAIDKILTTGFKLRGRKEEVRMLLLALLTGEHIAFLGPPGTGKTELCSRLASMLGGKAFAILMTKFTLPEELFGPISIQELKNDKYRRVTEDHLPNYEVGFLDEIFKASSAILNALLEIMSDRTFSNGGKREAVKVKTIVGSSNELPAKELTALWDRFLFRLEVPALSGPKFKKYITPTPEHGDPHEFLFDAVPSEARKADEDQQAPPEFLTAGFRYHVKKQAARVLIPDQIGETLTSLRTWLKESESAFRSCQEPRKYGSSGDLTSPEISDRRWKKLRELLQVIALTNGKTSVSIEDLWVLRHCLWDDPTHFLMIQQHLKEVICGFTSKTLLDHIDKVHPTPDPNEFAEKTAQPEQSASQSAVPPTAAAENPAEKPAEKPSEKPSEKPAAEGGTPKADNATETDKAAPAPQSTKGEAVERPSLADFCIYWERGIIDFCKAQKELRRLELAFRHHQWICYPPSMTPLVSLFGDLAVTPYKSLTESAKAFLQVLQNVTFPEDKKPLKEPEEIKVIIGMFFCFQNEAIWKLAINLLHQRVVDKADPATRTTAIELLDMLPELIDAMSWNLPTAELKKAQAEPRIASTVKIDRPAVPADKTPAFVDEPPEAPAEKLFDKREEKVRVDMPPASKVQLDGPSILKLCYVLSNLVTTPGASDKARTVIHASHVRVLVALAGQQFKFFSPNDPSGTCTPNLDDKAKFLRAMLRLLGASPDNAFEGIGETELQGFVIGLFDTRATDDSQSILNLAANIRSTALEYSYTLCVPLLRTCALDQEMPTNATSLSIIASYIPAERSQDQLSKAQGPLGDICTWLAEMLSALQTDLHQSWIDLLLQVAINLCNRCSEPSSQEKLFLAASELLAKCNAKVSVLRAIPPTQKSAIVLCQSLASLPLSRAPNKHRLLREMANFWSAFGESQLAAFQLLSWLSLKSSEDIREELFWIALPQFLENIGSPTLGGVFSFIPTKQASPDQFKLLLDLFTSALPLSAPTEAQVERIGTVIDANVEPATTRGFLSFVETSLTLFPTEAQGMFAGSQFWKHFADETARVRLKASLDKPEELAAELAKMKDPNAFHDSHPEPGEQVETAGGLAAYDLRGRRATPALDNASSSAAEPPLVQDHPDDSNDGGEMENDPVSETTDDTATAIATTYSAPMSPVPPPVSFQEPEASPVGTSASSPSLSPSSSSPYLPASGLSVQQLQQQIMDDERRQNPKAGSSSLSISSPTPTNVAASNNPFVQTGRLLSWSNTPISQQVQLEQQRLRMEEMLLRQQQQSQPPPHY